MKSFQIIFLVVVLCALRCASNQIKPTYTNKQASDCFTERAVQQCRSQIKKCTDDASCKEELATFQSCSFGLSETEIFNGNCFRRWNQRAHHTKQMINCLVSTCNLEYNSAISVDNLYRCSQETVINNFLQCDDNCGEELLKIRNGFNKYPIDELFSQPIDDETARKIVELIRQNCIETQYEEKARVSTQAEPQQSQQSAVIETQTEQQHEQPKQNEENPKEEQPQTGQASSESKNDQQEEL